MKKTGFYLIVIICIGFLISCDPGKEDLYYIDNKSDYDVLVYFNDRVNDTQIKIPSKEKQLIHQEGDLGIAEDRGDDFLYWADSLNLTINDSMKIEKDYLNRINWSFEVTGGDRRGDGGQSNYTFVINNEDIVSFGD
jgi:hypothetical protein